MTLTGILFIALMALLIVYLMILLNNSILDALCKWKGDKQQFKVKRHYKAVKAYKCVRCNGEGVIIDPRGMLTKCPICKGEGRVEL